MKYFEKTSARKRGRRKEKSLDDLIAGTLAAAVAVAATQPLEQAATLKTIKPLKENATKLQKILHKWQGGWKRTKKSALAGGVTFGTYGLVKNYLANR
jgi:hypothetical protein